MKIAKKNKKRNKLPGVLSGVAGEYYVAAELSRKGFIASLTIKNTKGIDILASNQDASRAVGIQVKTNQGNRKAWILHEKAETYFKKNFYYVFVNLNYGEGRPDFYIVPSKIVAGFIRKGHQQWLKTPGKKGQKHKNSPMRMFKDENRRYFEKWELLKLHI